MGFVSVCKFFFRRLCEGGIYSSSHRAIASISSSEYPCPFSAARKSRLFCSTIGLRRMAPMSSRLLASLICTPVVLVAQTFAFLKSASLKSAFLKSAPAKSALIKAAFLNFAPYNFAPIKAAFFKSAFLNFAPVKSASLKSVSFKSAPTKSTPSGKQTLRKLFPANHFLSSSVSGAVKVVNGTNGTLSPATILPAIAASICLRASAIVSQTIGFSTELPGASRTSSGLAAATSSDHASQSAAPTAHETPAETPEPPRGSQGTT